MITATRMDEWDPLSTRSTPRGIKKNELSTYWVIAPTKESYIATNHWRLELYSEAKPPQLQTYARLCRQRASINRISVE